MKNSVYLLAVSAVTFTLGVAIATYSITSGPGGMAKVKVGDSSLEIRINDVDFDKLFEDPRFRDEAKLKAKRLLDLHELDHALIRKIEGLAYEHELSIALRDLRDYFKGPFNAPDRKVNVAFSDEVDPKRARVCPSSEFHKKRINVALEDFSNMIPIEQADPSFQDCKPRQGAIETITISEEKGRSLLGVADSESLPDTIVAFVKELPAFTVILTN